MDLTDIYRTFHSKTKEYTFFPAPHCTLSIIDYIISSKTVLNRYKKIETIPCTLSDHHGLRLAFNNNKNNRKPTYTSKLNNTLLNDTLIKKEIRKEIKTFLEFNENEGTTILKCMGHNESSAKRKTHSTECLQKEAGESIH